MWIEGVVLKDHRHVAILGFDTGDVAVPDPNTAGIHRFQPGHHAQRRRLSASGRADQNDELTVTDDEVEAIQGRPVGTRELSRRLLESH